MFDRAITTLTLKFLTRVGPYHIRAFYQFAEGDLGRVQ
jgi:hypothetical protein